MVGFEIIHTVISQSLTMVKFRLDIMEKPDTCYFIRVDMINLPIILCFGHIINNFCGDSLSFSLDVELKGKLLRCLITSWVIPQIIVDNVIIQGIFMVDLELWVGDRGDEVLLRITLTNNFDDGTN